MLLACSAACVSLVAAAGKGLPLYPPQYSRILMGIPFTVSLQHQPMHVLRSRRGEGGISGAHPV
jgi:hypothetical protein